jgi:quercetin dioxygenase-like cupin family protein
MKMWAAASVLCAVSAMGQSAVGQAVTECKVIAPDATDGVLVAPENHKVLYEDADVRVIGVTVPPHSKETAHTHARPAILYIDEAATTRYTTPDTPDAKASAFRKVPITLRLKPEPLHAVENVGDTPFHAVRVELKHPGCSLSGAPPAELGPMDAVEASPKNHTVLYEDADVRVLDVHSQPHTRETLHTHAWPGVFYVIQGIPTRYYTPAKMDPPLRPAPPAGKVIYAAAEGPHFIANEGDVAGDRLRIELKYGSVKPEPKP